jgi:thioesterase domain-containing protein
MARHLSGRNPLPLEQQPLPVQLKEGTNIPIYFIGSGLWELSLAPRVSSDNSIFVLEVPWPSAWRVAALEKRTSALPTMEQLVAPYATALKARAYLAPCILAGCSFYGLMAFEAAHQLNECGARVEMVLLLDAKARYPTPRKVAWETVRNASSLHSKQLLSLLRWVLVRQLQLLRDRLKQSQDLGALTAKSDEMGMPLHWALVERIYSNAVKNYHLHCLDSRGVLFRAEQEEEPTRTLDGTLGWKDLFGKGLEIVPASGNHHTMMEPPHIRTLAHKMSTVLNR